MGPEYGFFIGVFCYAVIKIYALFHRNLIPKAKIDKASMREKIDFIAAFLEIKFDPKNPIPAVAVCEPGHLLAIRPDFDWYEEIYALYVASWNKIYINERYNNEDKLVHELTHYVRYQNRGNKTDKEWEENENIEGELIAEQVVKNYMRIHYPASYWSIMIPFALFNPWS